MEAIRKISDWYRRRKRLKVFKKAQPPERAYAVAYFGKNKDVSAVPLLVEALRDECGSIAVSAMDSLVNIGEPAIPELVGALKDKDLSVRGRAAVALGRIGSPSVAHVLISALNDKDLKAFAAVALGHMKDDSTVLVLIEALKDEKKDVRDRVVWALLEIVEKCGTIEEIGNVEKAIDEGSVALREEKDKDVRINAQIEIAWLTYKIAEKKDQLASKKDLLLTDKPKPPKKGRGVYQTARRVRNG